MRESEYGGSNLLLEMWRFPWRRCSTSRSYFRSSVGCASPLRRFLDSVRGSYHRWHSRASRCRSGWGPLGRDDWRGRCGCTHAWRGNATGCCHCWGRTRLTCFVDLRSRYGKFISSSDTGQDDIRDEGHRPEPQPHILRARHRASLCEISFQHDSVHRLHHGWLYRAQAGAARHNRQYSGGSPLRPLPVGLPAARRRYSSLRPDSPHVIATVSSSPDTGHLTPPCLTLIPHASSNSSSSSMVCWRRHPRGLTRCRRLFLC